MRRSKAEIALHFVWATHRRLPLITPEYESLLYAVLADQAGRMACRVLALGGMPDHVHLALRVPTKYAPAQLMHQIKGASSAWARVHLRPRQPRTAEPFGWQDGYGVFSISRSHVTRVIAYIENQKVRHEAGATALWREWEETDEEA